MQRGYILHRAVSACLILAPLAQSSTGLEHGGASYEEAGKTAAENGHRNVADVPLPSWRAKRSGPSAGGDLDANPLVCVSQTEPTITLVCKKISNTTRLKDIELLLNGSSAPLWRNLCRISSIQSHFELTCSWPSILIGHVVVNHTGSSNGTCRYDLVLSRAKRYRDCSFDLASAGRLQLTFNATGLLNIELHMLNLTQLVPERSSGVLPNDVNQSSWELVRTLEHRNRIGSETNSSAQFYEARLQLYARKLELPDNGDYLLNVYTKNGRKGTYPYELIVLDRLKLVNSSQQEIVVTGEDNVTVSFTVSGKALINTTCETVAAIEWNYVNGSGVVVLPATPVQSCYDERRYQLQSVVTLSKEEAKTFARTRTLLVGNARSPSGDLVNQTFKIVDTSLQTLSPPATTIDHGTDSQPPKLGRAHLSLAEILLIGLFGGGMLVALAYTVKKCNEYGCSARCISSLQTPVIGVSSVPSRPTRGVSVAAAHATEETGKQPRPPMLPLHQGETSSSVALGNDHPSSTCTTPIMQRVSETWSAKSADPPSQGLADAAAATDAPEQDDETLRPPPLPNHAAAGFPSNPLSEDMQQAGTATKGDVRKEDKHTMDRPTRCSVGPRIRQSYLNGKSLNKRGDPRIIRQLCLCLVGAEKTFFAVSCVDAVIPYTYSCGILDREGSAEYKVRQLVNKWFKDSPRSSNITVEEVAGIFIEAGEIEHCVAWLKRIDHPGLQQ